MFRKLFLITLSIISSSLIFADTPDDVAKRMLWFGQSSFKITTKNNLSIFIDPVEIRRYDKADIILITHNHSDHFSKYDINKLTKDDTVIIAPFNIEGKNKIMLPNSKLEVKGIKIETIPAYNIVKENHPKEKNFVGYIITVDGVRIYHSGDTERIPDIKNTNADIALLPVGQTFTMNSINEAVEAALDTKAKIVIPIHFGYYEGKLEDAQEFVDKLTKRNVKSFIFEKTYF